MNQAAVEESSRKMNRLARVVMPATQIPVYRTQIAIDQGVEKNLLFKTWGGLGDQICAEPTLRYALKSFSGCDISLASEQPELFEHLKFKRVFDLKQERPVYENYLVFETITPPDESNLVWQFFSHMLTNCVDFPSMCAYRCQLPIADKELRISSKAPALEFTSENVSKTIVIHPGRHWPTKTFPKDWWDGLIDRLVRNGKIPVLIGANTDDNRGTVDVCSSGCIDMRNKLSIAESVWLCQNSAVVLTNDSAPLHMAASGNAWIGFVATCKHPDFITHWRKGQWGYRMKNFGRGGIWDIINHCPNTSQNVTAEFVDESILRTWLPDPNEMADWALERIKDDSNSGV